MNETSTNKTNPRFQFGLRHLFAWMLALACAFTLGRMKEKYEPYLGDIGHLFILLTLAALGIASGVFTGRAIFGTAGAIFGAILGLVIIYAAFMLSVNLI